MRNYFKKRASIFIERIHDQVAVMLQGMEALKAYMAEQTSATELIITSEKRTDEARRIRIAEPNKTFTTPFDCEDIFSLFRTIDDVLDYAYSTVTEMEVLKVHPTSFMVSIASLLRYAAYELLMAVDRLELHPEVANEYAQRSKSLKNRVEDVYCTALADLFNGAEDIMHIMIMLKSSEVYHHLSNAADHGDQATNAIADIVVKIS